MGSRQGRICDDKRALLTNQTSTINHGMVWVGKDLKAHPAPTTTMRGDTSHRPGCTGPIHDHGHLQGWGTQNLSGQEDGLEDGVLLLQN